MVFFSRNLGAGAPLEFGRVGVWRDVAASRFGAVFAQIGAEFTELAHPEAYPDVSFLPSGADDEAGGADPVHISFRALDRLNYVKGARNIVAWPWRYPTLSDRFAPGTGIRENAVHMLSRADQIWCSSESAAATLARYGLHQAVAAPAPIAMADPAPEAVDRIDGHFVDVDGLVPRCPTPARVAELLARRAGPAPRLFVTVADPDDALGHFEAALRGFILAARAAESAGAPPLALVVVLALDPARRAAVRPDTWLRTIAEERFVQDADLVSRDVLIVHRMLSGPELIGLFDRSDFYLSPGAASDQNFPMQMAMARGAIPVALRAGEAAEYLTDEMSTAVAASSGSVHLFAEPAQRLERPRPRAQDTTPETLGGASTIAAPEPSPRQIADACLTAAALSPERRSAMAQAAAALVADRFSVRVAAARTRRLLAEFGADAREAAEAAPLRREVDPARSRRARDGRGAPGEAA